MPIAVSVYELCLDADIAKEVEMQVILVRTLQKLVEVQDAAGYQEAHIGLVAG